MAEQVKGHHPHAVAREGKLMHDVSSHGYAFNRGNFLLGPEQQVGNPV